MKRYSLVKCTISLILCIVCLMSAIISVSAIESNVLPKGDSDVIVTEETIVDQLKELLLNCSSNQERKLILKKAYQMGIDENEFTNFALSKADIEVLNGNFNETNSVKSRTVLMSDVSTASATSTNSTVAGVTMPTYALRPTIYKQATSTYCSAGTVYTVGKYIGATPPSQANIMSFWQSQWGVTYPDLPLIRNYLNNHLSNKPSDYVPYVNANYAGNQTDFNDYLKNNVLNYQPMILHMKNSSGTTNWPYTTGGHFCICSGLLTWENNKYFIGDPYYFSQYVSGATDNNGEHKRTWTQLNNVITNKFGSGSQYCLT